MNPLVIGVLGGIASGKSLVARLLAGSGGAVVDADAAAREVLGSPELRERIREHFGPAALRPDGTPDREVLARRVFADPEARARLESWIHPPVRARIHALVREARGAGRTPIVLDVPLLLENDAEHHLAELCDALVFVDSDPGERDRRAQAQRGWPEGEVLRREAAQTPLSEKRARAHHVIHNRGDLEQLERSVRDVLAALEAT